MLGDDLRRFAGESGVFQHTLNGYDVGLDFDGLSDDPVEGLSNLESVAHRQTDRTGAQATTSRHRDNGETRRRQDDDGAQELQAHGQPSVRIDRGEVSTEVGVNSPLVLQREALLLMVCSDRADALQTMNVSIKQAICNK